MMPSGFKRPTLSCTVTALAVPAVFAELWALLLIDLMSLFPGLVLLVFGSGTCWSIR